MSRTEFYYRNESAPKPNQPLSLGACVLLWQADKVLVELRSDSDRWGFIGGRVEMDESVESAAIREAFEETGLIIDDLHLHGVFSNPSRIIAYGDGSIKRVVTVVYSAEVPDAARLTLSSESRELRFFAPAELRTVALVETHLPILDSLFEPATH